MVARKQDGGRSKGKDFVKVVWENFQRAEGTYVGDMRAVPFNTRQWNCDSRHTVCSLDEFVDRILGDCCLWDCMLYSSYSF